MSEIESWAEKQRRRLAHIPILPLEELRKLPQAVDFDAGIYFLWTGDELVYVGKSRNIPDRLGRQSQFNRYHGMWTGRCPHIWNVAYPVGAASSPSEYSANDQRP